jgi:hypothetical protein
MAAEYLKITSTAPVRPAAVGGNAPRSAPAYQHKQQQPDEKDEKGDLLNFSKKALENLKNGGPPKKKPPFQTSLAWEELLNESNNRIRYLLIQLRRLNEQEIKAPSVLGETLKDAVHTLKNSGLHITKIYQEYSRDVPPGKIMVQAPSPGTNATRKMGVAVVVSKGPLREEDFSLMLRKGLFK